MNDLLIVMPAHNEENTIFEVITELQKAGYKSILVIDDASTDATNTRALEAGADVVSLPYNLGAWKATQTGIRFALEKGYKRVVAFDADGQHTPSSIERLISEQKVSQCDLVIGSCIRRGSVSRHIAWWFFRRLSGLNVKDLTSGLRLYNSRAIKALSSKGASLLEYQDVGVLLLLKSYGIKKSEVDVDMMERKDGHSRIFYSWWAVTYYMLYTTILCLSKIFKTSKF